jgi:large subunit ribosomal protein L17
MRHRVAHRKLGRVTEHRIAMLRNQATALLRHEHLTTTVPKAKELRPFVERLITIAKRGVSGGAENGKALHARRLVMQDLADRDVVKKLFDTLAPRFAARPGGYTRLLRLGFRRGDAAEIAQVELLGSEFNPRAAAESEAKKAEAPKATGVGGRLRAAAERLRRKRSDAPADGTTEESGAGQKPARTKAKGTAKARRKKSGEE